MLHTLHIFKKDSRHLWKEILVVTGMIAAFAYLGAHSRPVLTSYALPIDRLDAIYPLLLPLAWWYLIAAVVHEERILGIASSGSHVPIVVGAFWPLRFSSC